VRIVINGKNNEGDQWQAYARPDDITRFPLLRCQRKWQERQNNQSEDASGGKP
jgi:hypothetical protein